MVADELAARAGRSFRSKFNGELCEIELLGGPALLLKPMTFMNESGRSVRAVQAFYKLEVADTLVVHDELDLPFGEVRLKQGGGDAGHRGLRSVTAQLGSPDYVRLRFGIGRPPPDFRGSPADFVLEAFASVEKVELAQHVASAADAAGLIAERGLAAAMNTVNQRKPR
jgi:PTH1 family peptidyl-tRNA hydrolase